MWAEKLQLSKPVLRAANELGLTQPKEIQLKTLARIAGGQDLIAVGPEGCGKTTTYILSVLSRIKQGFGDAPRVLILADSKEKVLEITAQFAAFNTNKSRQIVPLYPAPGMETQLDALADGADIVIATPDRARAIYLKLALNLNKVELLIVDDADQIIKQGLQLPVAELANSIDKAQHLVFTEVLHDKLLKMIQPFMQQPAVVEVEELGETPLVTYDQLLYQVPNFRTKINLLQLFLQDAELFTKTVVFVNTVFTAENLYKSLQPKLKQQVMMLNPPFVDTPGFADVYQFEASAARVLIVANENSTLTDLSGVPFILHFELPQETQTYVDRVINPSPQENTETLAITFATDLELNLVRKIEQTIAQKIPVAALPEELVIEKHKPEPAEKTAVKTKNQAPEPGAAFHEKKASNAKTYNFSSGEKAKMNNKRKH